MPDLMIVRPLEENDYDQWLPLWEGYNAFYGRSGETALDPLITQTTWNRFFDEAEPVHALVAEGNGKLAGLCHFIFHRSTTSLGLTCYLQDLFTREDQRGMGIGKKLIERVYDIAKKAGSPRVYWLTHHTNSTARILYDKVAENSGFMVYRKMF